MCNLCVSVYVLPCVTFVSSAVLLPRPRLLILAPLLCVVVFVFDWLGGGFSPPPGPFPVYSDALSMWTMVMIPSILFTRKV